MAALVCASVLAIDEGVKIFFADKRRSGQSISYLTSGDKAAAGAEDSGSAWSPSNLRAPRGHGPSGQSACRARCAKYARPGHS